MTYKENEVIPVDADNLNHAEDAESYIQGAVDAVTLTANRIDWKQKLTSRKLWAAVVGVIVGLAAAFGIEENEYAQVVGVVGSVVSVVGYIFGEAKVDAARVKDGGKLPASENGTDPAENAVENGVNAVDPA